MQSQSLCFIAAALLLALSAVRASDDIGSDVKNFLTGGGEAKTSLDLKLGGDSAKIGIKTDDGNPFYSVECSAGISSDTGFGAGCERKWKPLFYGLLAGGGVLAALVLSCCCCCCCAPCRRKRAAAYYPVMSQTSSVILVNSEAPNPVSYPAQQPQPPKYDVQMLQA